MNFYGRIIGVVLAVFLALPFCECMNIHGMWSLMVGAFAGWAGAEAGALLQRAAERA